MAKIYNFWQQKYFKIVSRAKPRCYSHTRHPCESEDIFVSLPPPLESRWRQVQEKSDCLRLVGKTDYTIQALPIAMIVGLRTLVIFRGEDNYVLKTELKLRT
jgi:hypothetical protein